MQGEKIGINDFLDLWYQGKLGWSVFAVEASFEEVTRELLRFRHAKLIRQHAPVRLHKNSEAGADLGTVVKICNNPWVVVFRSLGKVPGDILLSTPREAEAISKRLRTRLVVFVAEDTSGSLSYTIYEAGKIVERAEWDMLGEKSVFKSRRRKTPLLQMKGLGFANAVFSDLGIYLPACYARQTAKTCWLAATKESATAIERATVLELRSGQEKLFEMWVAALGKGDTRAATKLGLI